MQKNILTKQIEIYQQNIQDAPRDYIGASSIGADCWRQIWYEFKGEKSTSVIPQTRRTWDIGRHLEGLVIEWLTKSGLEISTAPWSLQSSEISIFKGHIDALLIDKEKKVIVEIKTAKYSSFNNFVAKGLKLWSPQYYAQVQSYMGMSGIFSAYIVVLNKDNSDISDEKVEFDHVFYKTLEQKAKEISEAITPPPRINSSPFWYQCKMCKYHGVCHV
jgi:hypothetical protein